MPSDWNKLDTNQIPTKETMSACIDNPLFNNLCEHIETQYQAKPSLEYSACSMQAGWNMKYKKAGRSLCTLYPMEGFFIALVVIGERERDDAEMALLTMTGYTQQLYQNTAVGMGQRWLMISVTDERILTDVKRLVDIRRKSKKK
jgi:AraC family transcriptional regulator